MILKKPIKIERLLLCFLVTFILVDTCPHPNQPPGFIQTAFEHIQSTMMSNK
ncbi:MAG: hypothetical protein AAGF83_14270 [Cyanobacteria bacterium P01_G01_bin.67]